MIKRFFSSNIIHEQCSGSASVIAAGNTFKGFLSSGIPDLQLNVLIINLHSATAEFDANGQVMLLAEALVSELQQQARFANT